MDFFVVPTASLKVLFVLVVLAHDRRRVVHPFEPLIESSMHLRTGHFL
jgi:hypothetical protein